MHGQLPFDVKGMDDAVPTIDFTPDRIADPPYSLERVDVNGIVLRLASTFRTADSSPAAHTQI